MNDLYIKEQLHLNTIMAWLEKQEAELKGYFFSKDTLEEIVFNDEDVAEDYLCEHYSSEELVNDFIKEYKIRDLQRDLIKNVKYNDDQLHFNEIKSLLEKQKEQLKGSMLSADLLDERVIYEEDVAEEYLYDQDFSKEQVDEFIEDYEIRDLQHDLIENVKYSDDQLLLNEIKSLLEKQKEQLKGRLLSSDDLKEIVLKDENVAKQYLYEQMFETIRSDDFIEEFEIEDLQHDLIESVQVED